MAKVWKDVFGLWKDMDMDMEGYVDLLEEILDSGS